jgi:hypothetical protein
MTRVDSRPVSSAVREHFPAVVNAFRVNSHDDALTAKYFCGVANKLRPVHGSRIDRDFVSSGVQEFADIFDLVDSSADSKRHKNLFCSARDDIQDDLALFVGSGDIQKTEFVGALAVVPAGNFNRIARILEIKEFDAFDHAPGSNVEARYNSLRQHR